MTKRIEKSLDLIYSTYCAAWYFIQYLNGPDEDYRVSHNYQTKESAMGNYHKGEINWV